MAAKPLYTRSKGMKKVDALLAFACKCSMEELVELCETIQGNMAEPSVSVSTASTYIQLIRCIDSIGALRFPNAYNGWNHVSPARKADEAEFAKLR